MTQATGQRIVVNNFSNMIIIYNGTVLERLWPQQSQNSANRINYRYNVIVPPVKQSYIQDFYQLCTVYLIVQSYGITRLSSAAPSALVYSIFKAQCDEGTISGSVNKQLKLEEQRCNRERHQARALSLRSKVFISRADSRVVLALSTRWIIRKPSVLVKRSLTF